MQRYSERPPFRFKKYIPAAPKHLSRKHGIIRLYYTANINIYTLFINPGELVCFVVVYCFLSRIIDHCYQEGGWFKVSPFGNRTRRKAGDVARISCILSSSELDLIDLA